jgi:TM2 domain-containing membrane protein YozV
MGASRTRTRENLSGPAKNNRKQFQTKLAMYTIIGGDGKEYGPLSAEQIRVWQTEGRVNSRTSVCIEGTNDWRPLALFPELAAPPVVTPPTVNVRVALPGADKKIAAGLCGILLGQLGIHKFVLGYKEEGIIMLVITLGSIPAGVVTCGIGFLGIGVMGVIGLIEGIIYLTKSDEEFVATYITNKKGWF